MEIITLQADEVLTMLPRNQPNCLICGEESASRHYGSYCCPSCKGFFRRSAHFQRVYICSAQNKCNVTGEYRNACRACRYSKCLSVGMNPLLVQSDRGFIKRYKKCESLEGSASSDDYSSGSQPIKRIRDGIKSKSTLNSEALFTWRMPKYLTSSEINSPLGTLNLINKLSSNDPDVVGRYYATVEKIIDSYKESDHICHVTSSFPIKLNFCTAEVSDNPRLICHRTPLDWSANQYVTGPVINRIWARSVVSYLDWVSFIPELQDLSASDRNLMLINQSIKSVWLLYSHRTVITKAPGVVVSGGCYFPKTKETWKHCDSQVVAISSQMSDTFNTEIVDVMRDMDITDEEFAILRVLCFFTAVPQLSREGYKIVYNARRKYSNILTELVRVKNASKPFTEIIQRINRLMLLLPVAEKVAQINDDSMSVLILFNIAEMKQSLIYEHHVGKKQRSKDCLN